jgi:ABC-type antimicrobial peptide transport system permease subunit
VTVASRAAIERSLRDDSVSRAVSLALLATALLAAVLMIVGLLLTISVDVRDNRPELFDLESLGLPPVGLARHLWLRLAVVVGAGLVAGVVTGIVMALLVSDIVVVTANVTSAEPPLRAALDWPALTAGIVVFAVVALAAAAALTRAQFRSPAPDRPGVA